MNKNLEMQKKIGQRIRIIRTELNLSKDALGKMLGISGQFLGVIENGKSNLTYDRLKKFCEVSGYTADYILFGRDVKKIVETREELQKFSNEQIIEACELLSKIAIFVKNDKEDLDEELQNGTYEE